MRGLTEDELGLITHVSRWGSDGYPIQKQGRKWTWGAWRSVKGPPVLYATKREAIAAFERFHEILLDAKAGRI